MERTCKICGKTKEAVKSLWVTLHGKPVGNKCLACTAQISLNRYHANPDAKLKNLQAAIALRATPAGGIASRLAAFKYRSSSKGMQKIASIYAAVKDSAIFRQKRTEASLHWARENPDKANAKCNLRRAKKLNRTPKWSDKEKIAAVYKKATELTMLTGVSYVVDHIVPLQGELVSGLHVHYNLQILTRSENSIKGNKWKP